MMYMKKDNYYYKLTYKWSSKYSDFWSYDKYILKIRKDNCNVFGSVSIEEKNFQAQKEFDRGIYFCDNLYEGIVECYENDKYVGNGLLMKRLPYDHRLDKVLLHDEENIVFKIVDKIDAICQKSKIITDYNYFENIQLGNIRLFKNIKKLDGKWIQYQWDYIIKLTKEYKTVLNSRVKTSYIRELHGDLSFTNIFVIKDKIYFTDCCVASKDMYYLDILYQYADFCTELLTYDYYDYFYMVLNRISSNEFFDKKLFKYYLLRHILIRLTINYLANDEVFKNYKKAFEVTYYDHKSFG